MNLWDLHAVKGFQKDFGTWSHEMHQNVECMEVNCPYILVVRVTVVTIVIYPSKKRIYERNVLIYLLSKYNSMIMKLDLICNTLKRWTLNMTSVSC